MHNEATLRPVATAWVCAALAGLAAALWRWRAGVERPPRQEQLTYADVVDYFVKHQPDRNDLSGALLRQREPAGWRISFLYLDGDGQTCPAGNSTRKSRTLRVRNLDQELTEVFAEQDLILFH